MNIFFMLSCLFVFTAFPQVAQSQQTVLVAAPAFGSGANSAFPGAQNSPHFSKGPNASPHNMQGPNTSPHNTFKPTEKALPYPAHSYPYNTIMTSPSSIGKQPAPDTSGKK